MWNLKRKANFIEKENRMVVVRGWVKGQWAGVSQTSRISSEDLIVTIVYMALYT